MGRFDGRVAVVTGAGSGLGHATALRLASEGAAVGCLDIAGRRGREDRGRDRRAGRRRPARTRSTSPTPTRCAPRSTARPSDLGRPQVVVNCAGIGRFAHTHEVPFEDWQRIIGVNLTGTFLVCQAALPHLLDGGGVDRQHRVERGHQGAAVLRRVLRVEGRRRAPHQGASPTSTSSAASARTASRPAASRRRCRRSSWRCPKASTGRPSARSCRRSATRSPTRSRTSSLFLAVRRVPLHDRLDRLDRRRPHGLSRERSRCDVRRRAAASGS